MSDDIPTATETVVHDETTSNATAPTAIEPSEVTSSNGVHSNGTTNNTETPEIVHDAQDESNNDTCQDNSQSLLNKNDLEPESLRKVFIGGLSYKTDDQAFRDYFSKFGDIVVSRK
jgi:RNA recognition motif-containing protein